MVAIVKFGRFSLVMGSTFGILERVLSCLVNFCVCLNSQFDSPFSFSLVLLNSLFYIFCWVIMVYTV
jgi:hypothetical protein